VIYTALDSGLPSNLLLLFQINEVDFHDSILTLGVSEDICKELVSIYTSNKGEIRLILNELSLHPVQYQDLEWRLNVKVR